MRQSQLFTKTRKETPKGEVSHNAQLLIQGGFVHKEMAGVYSYLPLGLRVLEKIADIIREEMNAIGGQELLLTALQDPETWEKTGRWSDDVIDNWFKTQLASGGELGLGNTHEEPLTALMKQHVSSYKDLPRYVYQIQTKFRNELRAKSGIMRGREFLMKDLYSFSRAEKDFKEFYEKAAEAYTKVFDRVGLGGITYRTFASGEPFSEFSDEFQTLSKSGEDTIYIDEKKNTAVNKEVYADEVLEKLGFDKNNLREEKAIEVGNIFPLGTRFSEALGLTYRDENGKERHPVMGSYGIGIGRLMGTIVETHYDKNGIMWPECVAPYSVHLVALGEDEDVAQNANKLYEKLLAAGVEVLYDDRSDTSAGEKFADADLIGIPMRVVVSEKSLKQGGVEVKRRDSDEATIVKPENVITNDV